MLLRTFAVTCVATSAGCFKELPPLPPLVDTAEGSDAVSDTEPGIDSTQQALDSTISPDVTDQGDIVTPQLDAETGATEPPLDTLLPVDCSHLDDQCNLGIWSDDSVCTAAPVNEGGNCNDMNPCTADDRCEAGVCSGTDKTCSTSVVCKVSDCDPTTGECVEVDEQDGASCSDGEPCTIDDVCSSGFCVGDPNPCLAPDDCHGDGSCTEGVGCGFPTLANGTPCDDGNACTLDDECNGGLCGSSSTVTCLALDQCHLAGTCNPLTGCTNPAVEDGTPCDDSDICSVTEACLSGDCTPTVSLSDASTDWNLVLPSTSLAGAFTSGGGSSSYVLGVDATTDFGVSSLGANLAVTISPGDTAVATLRVDDGGLQQIDLVGTGSVDLASVKAGGGYDAAGVVGRSVLALIADGPVLDENGQSIFEEVWTAPDSYPLGYFGYRVDTVNSISGAFWTDSGGTLEIQALAPAGPNVDGVLVTKFTTCLNVSRIDSYWDSLNMITVDEEVVDVVCSAGTGIAMLHLSSVLRTTQTTLIRSNAPESLVVLAAASDQASTSHALAGSFEDALVFANGGGLLGPHSETGSPDAFVAKFANNGQLVWKRTLGTAGVDRIDAVAFGPDGSVFVAGQVWSGDFEVGSPSTVFSTSTTAPGGFVGKFTPTGDLEWVHRFEQVSSGPATLASIRTPTLTVRDDGTVAALLVTSNITSAGATVQIDTPAIGAVGHEYAIGVLELNPDGTRRWGSLVASYAHDDGSLSAPTSLLLAHPDTPAFTVAAIPASTISNATIGSATQTVLGSLERPLLMSYINSADAQICQ